MEDKKNDYAKRPLWQWIVLYLVIGGILYLVVYYFLFARKVGYNASPAYGSSTTQTAPRSLNY